MPRFGRIRNDLPWWPARCWREERLVLAIPLDSPLAANAGHISLSELNGQKLIVYPKEPRPSSTDDVLSFLNDQDIRPSEIHEVRDLRPPWAWWRRNMGCA